MRRTNLTQLPDEQLARLAQSGDDAVWSQAAAAELLGRYRGRVYAWCRRCLRDRERALDCSQEVLLDAFRALASFEGRAPFAAWLFAITRHRCIRASRRPSLTRDEEADLEAIPDPRGGPDELVERRLEEDALLGLIRDHLEPKEQRALWLRCVERLPVEEITERLGLTNASGARAVLQAARRKLRAALEESATRKESPA